MTFAIYTQTRHNTQNINKMKKEINHTRYYGHVLSNTVRQLQIDLEHQRNHSLELHKIIQRHSDGDNLSVKLPPSPSFDAPETFMLPGRLIKPYTSRPLPPFPS